VTRPVHVALASAIAIAAFSPAWSHIALRFVATQEQAPTAAVVVVRMGANGEQQLHVLRVIFGKVQDDFVPSHPGWFSEQLGDGRQYVVLLADGEAYRGAVTEDGFPIIACGVINAMEVANGQIVDPSLYDVKYMGSRKRLSLEMVERDLAKSHKEQRGV